MNWSQLRTVLWLRWRLTRNQMTRKRAEAVISLVLLVLGVLLCLGSVVGGFLGGWLGLSNASPTVHLVVWDTLLAVFGLLWVMGILLEVQRSESVGIDRLLHLPVSIPQIFAINYLASHANPILLIFVPGMLGLAAGLVAAKGMVWVVLGPLILAFVFTVTAWTYFLRGWLVSLMANKRRRRAIIVGLTMGFILLGQVPNLLFSIKRGTRSESPPPPVRQAERNIPDGSRREGLKRLLAVHQWLPPFWLPYGAMRLAENRPWPALGGCAGLLVLGTLGLHRAYRGTIRFYQGIQRGKRGRPKKAPASAKRRGGNWLEGRLPGLSESASVLTLAFFRSLLRAPESKMVLMMPFLMAIVFGSLFFRRAEAPPELAQMFMPTALGFFVLMGMIQLFSNHFGFDRNGFCVLVLAPVPRQHVLLAKNLALLAIGLGLELIFLCLLFLVMHPSWEDALTGLAQFLTGFLCFAFLGNLASILAPWRIEPGSLKPTKMRAQTKVMIAALHLFFPVVLIPVALPILLQVFCLYQGWLPGLPVHLLGSIISLVIVGFLYYHGLEWQGRLLQSREKTILQVVSQEVE